MLIILHGENILKSRQELERIKTQDNQVEIILFDGAKIDHTCLKQALESKPFLEEKRLVIIENLLSQKKNLKQQKTILDYLKNPPIKTDLILWEEREIGKELLSRVSATVKLFKTEPILFKFLEAIRPGNTKEILTLLRESLLAEEPEIVFYMLTRQFRNLILIADLGEKGLPRMASWQISRLKNQAKNFTLEQLLKIYHELLEIDYRQKTGQQTFDLAHTLELFLINL